MFLLQCALVGILYYISNVYSSFGGFIVSKYMLQRPLVGGLLCGVIFGDIKTGLEIGVALQLAFMGVFAVGGAIAMDVGTLSLIHILSRKLLNQSNRRILRFSHKSRPPA